MGDTTEPPDKGRGRMVNRNRETDRRMTRKRNRRSASNRSDRSANSNKSAISSQNDELFDIDNKKYTKGELKKFIRELKVNSTSQNKVISDLNTQIQELNKTVQGLLAVQGKAQAKNHDSKTPNDSIQNNQMDTSSVTIEDDSGDDDNEIMKELLNVNTNAMNPYIKPLQSQQSEIFELLKQNKALLASDDDTNQTDRSVNKEVIDNNNNDERHNSGDSESGTVSSDSSSARRRNVTQNMGDNRIFISNPKQTNETEGNKKLKFDKKKSPEIVVFNIQNKKETIVHLKNMLGHDRFLLRTINKDKTGILTENNVDRKKILEFLDNNYSRYFTYTPINEKPLNLLIKYIDSSFTEDDVKSDLLKLNTEVKLLKIKIFETSKPLFGKHIWLVQTENNEKTKSILGSQKLCSSIVKIEILKSNSVLQCKKCQRFEHSASNCHNAYRCVKCGKEEGETDSNNVVIGHKPGECPLVSNKNEGASQTDTLFCCNCKKSGHTANYTKCEKFAEQIQKRNIRIAKAEEKKSMFNNFITNGMSFAEQVKFNQNNNNNGGAKVNKKRPQSSSQDNTHTKPIHNNTNNPNNTSFIQAECTKLLGDDLFTILTKINAFIPQYKSLDNSQKPIRLLEFLFNLSSKNGN